MSGRARIASLAATLALCALPAAFPGMALPSATDGHWVELGPPARQEHTLVHDPVHQRLVLFGGRSNVASNAVYFLDLATHEWSRIEPAGAAPTARYGHAAVYDPIRQRMVVFGGFDGSPRDDAWALSLDGAPAWSQLAPAGAPPAARYRLAGVYDALRDRLVIHGGDGGAGLLDDTWALSFAGGGAWAPVTPAAGAPAARSQHAGAYDPVRDRLLVFGGQGAGGLLGDAWALDLASQTWSAIAATGGPPAPRKLAAGVYDPQSDALLVIGGFENPLPVADTWSLSLGGSPAWSQKASPGLYALAACHVPALQGVVTHGGYNYSFTHTRTYLLDPGTFSSVSVLAEGGPWLRRNLDGAFDTARERLVMFGGDAASGFDPAPTHETWALASDGDFAWSRLADGLPGSRWNHTLTHDPGGDRMILFGGNAIYGPLLGDTWSLDLATDVWSELTFAGPTPAPREFHTTIYDPVAERLVVFGGFVDGGLSNELWQLDLTGTPAWSPLAASGTPPAPRGLHVAVYDPVGHRMLVFDGSGPFAQPLPDSFNDLWALSLDGAPAWQQLAPLGASPGGAYYRAWRAVYDPPRHRVLVFGESGTAHQLVLTGTPRWAPLVTTGPAPVVPRQPLVYDPGADRLLVFGGNFGDATLALELDPAGTVSTPPPPAAAAFTLRRVAPNPARVSFTVSFELPRHGAVALELIDVAGRRVTGRELEPLPAGRHDVTLGIPDLACPGVYFLRLEFEGSVIRSKLALIR